MPRPKGGTIPAKAQIPLAGVLIVVFAAILFWPSDKKREKAVEAVLQVSVETPSAKLQRAELLSLIDQLAEDSDADAADTSSHAPLHRDPFAPTSALFPNLAEENFENATRAGVDELSERGVVRKQFLADIVLSAVFSMGDESVAVIDDNYVRVGDRVGGFTIRSIQGDSIVLEDKLGHVTLQIREP